jgi:hypothetical protein
MLEMRQSAAAAICGIRMVTIVLLIGAARDPQRLTGCRPARRHGA